jgi:acetylornithine deacetylase/succinyl-diaminopimelate desuccinylase-like protein
MVDKNDVIGLVSELVRIDSVNPWLVQGGAGESQVARFIREWLEKLGVEVTLEEVEPGRSNLLARWHGTGGGDSLCIYAHMDTVGYALWPEKALTPRVEEDRIVGLGSADDKGHCAAAMLAMKSLIEAGMRLEGDLWLGLLIDEEGASSGAFHFAEHHKPDAMLVLEPFGLGRVNITHQGFGWLDIIVRGKAAHGSAPEVGVDAILHMAEVIVRLGKLDREKYAPTRHPLNDKIVFHTGTISGGTDYATYPDRCVLGIEIGTQPGESIQDRVAEIEAIFSDVKKTYPDFNGAVEVKLAREPFEARGHEKLWDILTSEINKEIGKPVEAAGENAWGDAQIFQDAGIPTLMIGASGDHLHAPEEWVSLSELTQLVKIVGNTTERFCGRVKD